MRTAANRERRHAQLEAKKTKRAAGEAEVLARRGKKIRSWGGWAGGAVVLYERCITYKQKEYPLAGTEATVEETGSVSIAKNRTLKTGLLHSRTTTEDTRQTHLTVRTSEGQFVVSTKGSDPNGRGFAAAVNTRTQELAGPPRAPAPSNGSLADELAKLAALRDAGVLTPEEFDTQKQRLLRP